ncbi:N-alpha-acetyltransferase 38, NatC auxiliary subunit [Anabarilius grahami]|uniref:N-alpha-acetyltransferase 38, NatC auxiliary subunit n=1 Tax=Anabarilius grahami TaxID=495550 RepID=A0A3N0XVA1_ANAGA|nr:N-alpha-acetyltransferase 38, NatC auxiliary subunit [Anabarilius grahami]
MARRTDELRRRLNMSNRPKKADEDQLQKRKLKGGTEVEESAYSLARCKLENLLNKSMRIRMTDGRTLVGLFLCTDRDCNVILGSAQEFLKSTDSFSQGEPRVLGLAMIPGHHVVSIEVESESLQTTTHGL